MHRFSNKVAIVTGAAGGIGSAAARRLIDEGAKVMLGISIRNAGNDTPVQGHLSAGIRIG